MRTKLIYKLKECGEMLTPCCSMPGRSVGGAVFLSKVLSVAHAAAGISHESVGGRIGKRQPAEDMVIWCGCLLLCNPM